MSQQKRHYWWKRDHSDKKYVPPQDPFDYEAGERKIVAPYTYVERHLQKNIPSDDTGKGFETMADTFALGQVRSKTARNVADRKFAEDFRRWLTKTNSTATYPNNSGGKSTATQGTRIQKNRDGSFKRLPPNFATRPLLQVPGCSGYIDSFVQAQGDFKKKYMPLLAFGPKDLDEAYLYYKYIVVPGFDPTNPNQVQEFLDDYDFYTSQRQADEAGAPGALTIVPNDAEDVENNQWPYRRKTGSDIGFKEGYEDQPTGLRAPILVEEEEEFRVESTRQGEPAAGVPEQGSSTDIFMGDISDDEEGYETTETREVFEEEGQFEQEEVLIDPETIKQNFEGIRTQYEEQIRQLGSELNEAGEQNRAGLEERQKLYQDLSEKASELADIQQRLSTEEGRKTQLEDRIKQIESDYTQQRSQYESEIESLKSQLETAKQKEETTVGELRSLESSLTESSQRFSSLDEEKKRIIESHRREQERYEKLIRDKDQAIRLLEQQEGQDKQELRNELQTKTQTITSLEAAIVSKENEISNLKNFVSQLQQENQNVTTKLATLQQEASGVVAQYEATNQQLQQRVTQQEGQLESAEAVFNQQKEQLQELNTQLEETKTELSQKSRELAQRTQEAQNERELTAQQGMQLGELRGQVDELSRQLQDYENERQRLESLIAQEQQTITGLQQVITNKDAQIQELARQKQILQSDYNTRVNELESQIASLNTKIAYEQQTATSLREYGIQQTDLAIQNAKKAARLESEYESMQRELSDLQTIFGDQRSILTGERDQLQGQVFLLQQQIETLQTEAQDISQFGEARESELESEINELREKISTLRKTALRYRDQRNIAEDEASILRSQVPEDVYNVPGQQFQSLSTISPEESAARGRQLKQEFLQKVYATYNDKDQLIKLLLQREGRPEVTNPATGRPYKEFEKAFVDLSFDEWRNLIGELPVPSGEAMVNIKEIATEYLEQGDVPVEYYEILADEDKLDAFIVTLMDLTHKFGQQTQDKDYLARMSQSAQGRESLQNWFTSYQETLQGLQSIRRTPGKLSQIANNYKRMLEELKGGQRRTLPQTFFQ